MHLVPQAVPAPLALSNCPMPPLFSMPSAAEIVAALTIYMYGGWQAMALRVGVCMSWAGCARHLHQLTVLHCTVCEVPLQRCLVSKKTSWRMRILQTVCLVTNLCQPQNE